MSSTRAAAACLALVWWGGYFQEKPLIAQVLAMPPSTVIEPLVGQDSASLPMEPSGLGLDPAADRWDWQLLPSGLIYRSYLAGGRESRLAAQVRHERDAGWLFDATLGGRAGLLRYGSRDTLQPEGWQLDVEGAAFPRVTLWDERFLVSSDFRGGFPLTFRRGPVEAKLAFYHLSSHLGDQFMLITGRPAIDYSRDALVLGLGLRPVECVRLYAEADWAFHMTGFSDPWQFQFGAELSSPLPTGCGGGPFAAVNGVIRQDVDYGGNFTVQAGWQWRGTAGQLLRAGFHYSTGKSDQGQFFREHEELIGMGVWYDF